MATDDTAKQDLLFQKLNQETGKINWKELQRHFARGVVVTIAKDLDLIKIAEQFSQDQGKAIQALIESGKIHRATDNDAATWNKRSQDFWAVVIAPWVLVQEI